jgi:osmoprotectant transport system ATP-binding protein
MPSAVGAMLALERVRKSYDGGQSHAVDGVAFEVADGELVALVGESGSGKTTLLKLINRLVEPTSGCIRVDGRDVSGIDPVSLRRSIGYVIQGVGLFPHLSVAENVAAVPSLLGWEASRIDARVAELLRLVRLPVEDFGRRMPRELSGGQMQRVGFARALAAEPSLVLLDEPFGALDPINRDRLRGEFAAIQRQAGFSAVLVTHDMTEALLVADRIVVMRQGRAVQIGAPAELLARPSEPYVAELLAAARHQARRLADLAGVPSAPAPG